MNSEAATTGNIRRFQPRRFLFVLAFVSVTLNKIMLCIEFMNFHSIMTYFWFPSVFFFDVLFLVIVYAGLYHSKKKCALTVICTIAILFTALVVAFQVTAVIGQHVTMPWALSFWALMEWKDFYMIVKAKTAETFVQVWMVALVQVTWTLLLTLSSSRRKPGILPCILLPARSLVPTFNMKRNPSRLHACALAIAYLSVAATFRPDVPYKKLSQTPCVSVPIEMVKGIHDYRSHSQMARKRSDDLKGILHQVPADVKSNNDIGFEPLNVVILFMESVRADMMPFDPFTRWAQRFVPDPHVEITPFYSNWTKSNDTWYIPQIKSASGLTHKSLLSTLCSMHALPIQGTVEPFHPLYHACLPHLLAQYNYSSIHLQPQTEEFEHQKVCV